MNESKPFIEYSNDINDIYKSIEEYNRNKNRKILLVCHDVIANMANNKKRNPITKLFVRGRKLTIYLIFVIQSNFAVSKHITVNGTHYFIMKIRNKWELQRIALNHSSDIDSINLYKSILIFSYWCYSCVR